MSEMQSFDEDDYSSRISRSGSSRSGSSRSGSSTSSSYDSHDQSQDPYPPETAPLQLTSEPADEPNDNTSNAQRWIWIGASCFCITCCCCLVIAGIVVGVLIGTGVIVTKAASELDEQSLVPSIAPTTNTVDSMAPSIVNITDAPTRVPPTRPPTERPTLAPTQFWALTWAQDHLPEATLRAIFDNDDDGTSTSTTIETDDVWFVSETSLAPTMVPATTNATTMPSSSPPSAAQRAYEWMLTDAYFMPETSLQLLESGFRNAADDFITKQQHRFGLATLYYATNGPEWASPTNWLSDTDECTWEHYTCSTNMMASDHMDDDTTTNSQDDPFTNDVETNQNNITNNDQDPNSFENNDDTTNNNNNDTGMAGSADSSSETVTIETSPGYPAEWTTQSLHAPSTTPPRPSQRRPLLRRNLQESQAVTGESDSNNDTATADSIGNPTGGAILGLRNLPLQGTLPEESMLLVSLEQLLLSHHDDDDSSTGGGRLTGRIPSTIGMLTNLTMLHLDNNALTGAIPTEIGLLTALQEFLLDHNQLSGNLPRTFSSLENMTTLTLNANLFTGNVPQELCFLLQPGVGSLQEIPIDCNRQYCTCDCTCAQEDEEDDMAMTNDTTTTTTGNVFDHDDGTTMAPTSSLLAANGSPSTTMEPTRIIPAGDSSLTPSPASATSPGSMMACNGLEELCSRSLNQVLFAMVHNAMATPDNNFFLVNHQRPIVSALEAGFRGINLDVCNCGGTLVFCHGICELGQAPLVSTFQVLTDFLTSNPQEVLFVPLQLNSDADQPVDLVALAMELQTIPEFQQLLYVHPSKSAPWPTLGDLILTGQRLVLFHFNGPVCESLEDCPDGFHYYFDYVGETSFEFNTASAMLNAASSCPIRRGGSSPYLSFYGVNMFLSVPTESSASGLNAYDFIQERVQSCSLVTGEPFVNILYVDFWEVGDVVEFVRDYNQKPVAGRSPTTLIIPVMGTPTTKPNDLVTDGLPLGISTDSPSSPTYAEITRSPVATPATSSSTAAPILTSSSTAAPILASSTTTMPSSLLADSSSTASPTGSMPQSLQRNTLLDDFEAQLPDSTRAQLAVPGTPQIRAYMWLAEDPGLLAYYRRTALLTTRFSLATLYYSTGGDETWSGWLDFLSECMWENIVCDEVENLSLFLGESGLVGSLPPDIGALTQVLEFHAPNNALSNVLPSELSQWTRLSTMDLGWNNLTSTIPDELTTWTGMKVWNLTHNQLSGSLPGVVFDSMTLLEGLDVSGNRFTGTIPLLPTVQLRNLTLNDNMLSGALPRELSAMSLLQILDVSNNKLTGSVPDLTLLTDLEHLNVASNRDLKGEIPFLAPLVNLKTANFSDTDLTGDLNANCPTWLADKTKVAVDCKKVVCDCCCQGVEDQDDWP